MTPRYHAAKPVRKCPRCGHTMELGSRVKVLLCWEKGDRLKFASTSGYVCRTCGAKTAEQCALDVPDEVWPHM